MSNSLVYAMICNTKNDKRRKHMYKIKEFSIRCGVSIDTLKYYDSIDLFKPLYVDQESQYRYYDAKQIHTINRIQILKQSHFSLTEIKNIIDQRIKNEKLIEIMNEKAMLLTKDIQCITQQLNQLYTNIFMVKNGGISLMQEILIKEVEQIMVVSKKEILNQDNESFDQFCERLWENIETYIDKNKLKKSIPCMSIYYSGFYIHTDMPVEMEVAIPILGEANLVGGKDIRNLPKIKVASIVHDGGFDTIGDTYQILLEWIAANHYTPDGPVREVYHKGEWVTENMKNYITEIQVPIK